MPDLQTRSRERINTSYPMSRDMLEYFTMRSNPGRARRGEFDNRLVSVDPDFTFPGVGALGEELTILDTVGTSQVATGDFIPNSSPITVLVRFRMNAALGSDTRIFSSNSGASAIICRSIGSGTVEFLINSLTNDRISHSITYNAGEEMWIGGSWAGDPSPMSVISWTVTDGFKITTDGSDSTGTYTNSNQQFNANSNMGTIAGITDAPFWARRVSESELREFINDPDQVLLPKRALRRFKVPAAPGGGVVWSLANRGGLAGPSGLAGTGGGLAG